MTDQDTLLLETQERVQRFLASEVERLLDADGDEIAWEEWMASVRFSSEETWLRCNAFLLAHTLGRFLSRRVPVGGAARIPWVDAFAAAVAAGDAEAELVLWASVPVDNPRADVSARYSAALWLLGEALRTSRPLDASRPGPYSRPVWFDDADLPGSSGDGLG